MAKSREVRDQEHIAHKGDMRKAYKIVVRKPEIEDRLGRPSYRMDGNIKMDLE
jgi:hypothetical protein